MNSIYQLIQNLEPKKNVNILMYHGFIDQMFSQGFANYHGKHLHINKFREQMAHLKKYFHVISLRHLLAFYHHQESIPERSVIITIDDGYQSNYTLAYPILKEYALPATIFIATDFVDQKEFLWVDRVEYALITTKKKDLKLTIESKEFQYSLSDSSQRKFADEDIKSRLKRFSSSTRNMIVQELENQLDTQLTNQSKDIEMYVPLEWTQIAEMIHSGLITIGSHGSSHTIATSFAENDFRADLQKSRERIKEMTRTKCELFSYPNGGAEDFNHVTRKIVQEQSFDFALTTMIGANHSTSDVYELKRLNIHNEGDLTGFIRTLSSTCRFIRKLRYASLRGNQS